MDWNDLEFRAEALQCLTPKNAVECLSLPKDRITVAIHVTKNKSPDSPSELSSSLKFPPDSYYIQQIQLISRIFEDQPIYVYIFSDDSNGEAIVENFRKAVNKPNIEFGCRKPSEDLSKQLLEDFSSLSKFDCLIIPQSNLSLIRSKINDYALTITPLHSVKNGNEVVIDQIELAFNSLRQTPFQYRDLSLENRSKILAKREEVKNMTTSIVVPCYGKHFTHLKGLLESYVNQSCLPDEIVVSLSNVEEIKKEEIDELEKKGWPFRLKILRSEGKRSAGENRNIASEGSTGDIILCQDADDLPHPQRVEVVKYLFENFNIDHLIHQWVDSEKKFIPLNKKGEKVFKCDTYENAKSIEFIHNGQCCYTREVIKEVKWPTHFNRGQDVEYNKNVYEKIKNKVVLQAALIAYREDLGWYALEKKQPK